MPALSPTMTEGKIATWLKNEGDKVKAGDVLAEIETDKATMEVEAVDEGSSRKILVPEGTEDVAVNTPIAVIAGEGEDVDAAGASRAGRREALHRAEAAAAAPRRRRRSRRRAAAAAAAAAPRPRPSRNTPAPPRRSPCARPCATPWPRRCGATTRSS